MDEYNAVRTCCQDANVCPRCWKFMQAACAVLDKALRDDFGFDLIAWFFSGRRGIHAWICDERARDMSNEARGAVAEYLRIVSVSKVEVE
jgi:DNA primase small subunit